MIEMITLIIIETWQVTARMAPWLLLGFLVAGLLSVFISPVWLERHLGGRGMGPVFKASLFGVPLPLCSCGVIPVAASLRQHGSSRSATTAFLLSTPQTGVDSILVTWTMLGPLFAIFRPVAALLTGLLGGGLVQTFAPDTHRTTSDGKGLEGAGSGDIVRPQGLGPKMTAAFDYGFVTLPGDIGRALLVGLVIAGILGAVVPADFLARYLGSGALSVALMMIVGIPIYVCATASVPLAASFIFMGASPGAALAFLIAGPATNAATVTTIFRVLGRKTTIIYLLTVAVSAFGGGLLLDWVLPRAAAAIPLLGEAGHHHEGIGWFDHAAGAALVFIMSFSWWLSRRRGHSCGCEAEETCAVNDDSRTLEFAVEGMNCSHCSGSVMRAVSELEGVSDCQVFLDDGRAVVRGRDLDPQKIAGVIEGLGFKAGRRS
ncbi:MAG: permease [Candidatus Krumholzibacteriota bacterium]